MERQELIELLKEANSNVAKIEIQKKDYVAVNERIKAFRYIYPNGLIKTEIISLQDGVCVMKCEVFDDNGQLLATGHAYEKEGSSFINKTSYIENCETSAIGRALGFIGIGVDTSIASYEEVANAKAQQEEKVQKIKSETWDNLKKAFTTEQIKGFYQELGITAGKDIPEKFAQEKLMEVLKQKGTDFPQKDFY